MNTHHDGVHIYQHKLQFNLIKMFEVQMLVFSNNNFRVKVFLSPLSYKRNNALLRKIIMLHYVKQMINVMLETLLILCKDKISKLETFPKQSSQVRAACVSLKKTFSISKPRSLGKQAVEILEFECRCCRILLRSIMTNYVLVKSFPFRSIC